MQKGAGMAPFSLAAFRWGQCGNFPILNIA